MGGIKPDTSTFPIKGSGDFVISSFRARSEPKGIQRVLEKTEEAIEEEVTKGESERILRLEPDLAGISEGAQEDQLALLEFLTPGCYICDILGAEVSVGSFRELLTLYNMWCSFTLAKDGCQVVRVKNGFSKDAEEAAGGYKDLKLWVMVASQGRYLTAELQMHIHSVLEVKKYMHLAYECYRGSFDHSHLAETWTNVPVLAPAPVPLLQPEIQEPKEEPELPKKGLAACCASLCGKKA